jgi:hypothetical protein
MEGGSLIEISLIDGIVNRGTTVLLVRERKIQIKITVFVNMLVPDTNFLTMNSRKMTVFWDVAPCSLVCGRFRGACCSIIKAMSKPLARNWLEIWDLVGLVHISLTNSSP